MPQHSSLPPSGARYYHSALSLWLSADPLADKYPNLSPYSYCAGNPVRNFDPDGRDWVEDNETGNVTWNKNVTSMDNTPQGYTYRGTSYSRERIWTNIDIGNGIESGLMHEEYQNDGTWTHTNLTPWMQIAFGEMNQGIAENGHNPEILKYFKFTQITTKTDATPWCAAFINYCLETAGIAGTGSALAYSFKSYGENLGNTPAYGAIAIMNYSHVGFVAGEDQSGRIALLGGNQANAVNISPNISSNAIKFVYPAGYTSIEKELPKLKVHNRQLLDGKNTR